MTYRIHQKKCNNKRLNDQDVRVERCWLAWLQSWWHQWNSYPAVTPSGIWWTSWEPGCECPDRRGRESQRWSQTTTQQKCTGHAPLRVWWDIKDLDSNAQSLARGSLTSGWSGMCGSPVTRMSSQDLSEAVTPEKSSQNYSRVNLTPVERLCHGHHADRHGHPRAVEQAGAQDQHHAPFFCQGSEKVWRKNCTDTEGVYKTSSKH